MKKKNTITQKDILKGVRKKMPPPTKVYKSNKKDKLDQIIKKERTDLTDLC